MVIQKNLNDIQPGKRIESIDVLRAVVLLGILTVHCFGGFSMGLSQSHATPLDSHISDFVALFINQKCNPAFATLFGISFYLILRKPKASAVKFAWRCLLLICIGLVNKIFYWYDVLMLYGTVGLVLTLFRNFTTKYLFIFSALFYVIAIYIEPILHPQDILFPDGVDRWLPNPSSFREIVSRPIINGVKAYLYYIMENAGCGIRGIALTMAGYAIGKSGVIERLDTLMHKRVLVLLWITSILTFVIRYKHLLPHALEPFALLDNIIACLTYSYTLLYLYYKCHCDKWLNFLAPYGRMGLTNYSLQGLAGAWFFSSSGLTLCQAPVLEILAYILLFYIAQVFFSRWWMRKMYYGPLEWVWRCSTNLKIIPLLRHTH